MALGQKLGEDLESKVRLSGWDRLRGMNGRLIGEGSGRESEGTGWVTLLRPPSKAFLLRARGTGHSGLGTER